MAISLALGSLWGIFFSPTPVIAGIISSIFGGEVSADINIPAQEDNVNLQTMALLQANFSTLPDSSSSKSSSKDEIDESAAVNILSDNALFPETSPLGTLSGTGSGELSYDQVSVYVVRSGDSLSQIAEMFDVSINTILSANDMKRGDKLIPGTVLVILPISGVEHTVAKGDTLASIAKKYEVEVNEILLYNGLASGAALTIGDKLLIPGGEMADEGGDQPAPNLSQTIARDKQYYATSSLKNASGYFVNPLPGCKKTQGLHGPGRRGIDIGCPTGTPIYASAKGTVLIAKTGWSGGYGNMVIIQHPNGTKTLYAHLSRLGITTGSSVKQGQVIGYVGSTGRSTGPHLHFEVFNAKNPGADWSWAN